MGTVQFRVENDLKDRAFGVLDQLDIPPSDALRMFLRYVAENNRLPFSEISLVVANEDSDSDILNLVRERIKNPQDRVRVSLDDL